MQNMERKEINGGKKKTKIFIQIKTGKNCKTIKIA